MTPSTVPPDTSRQPGQDAERQIVLQWTSTLPGLDAATQRITAPGCTVGRWPGNGLALPDDGDSNAPVQGVIRVNEQGEWELYNLCARTPPRINGQPMAYRQRNALQPGDLLTFSASHTLQVLAVDDIQAAPPVGSLSAAPASPPQADPAPATELPDIDLAAPADRTDDLFADIFGAGTVPVGAMPGLSERHPFDLGGAADALTDPLGKTSPGVGLDSLNAHADKDPLKPFPHAADALPSHRRATAACITDSHPSLLPRHPVTPQDESGHDILSSLSPRNADKADRDDPARRAQQNHANPLHSSLRHF